MIEKQIFPAFADDALYAKSKVYVGRALAAKQRDAMDEYQLWASLALELLGKAALSQIHPCLIADPQSKVSLFAAAGMNIGTELKTITAKTLFDRMTHVSKRFDKKAQDFCTAMSDRRNAELHSGELPFQGMVPSAWEGRFWHTAEILLRVQDQTFEAWLGVNEAKAPRELVAAYDDAVREKTKIWIETARHDFELLPRAEREARQGRAASLQAWEMYRGFQMQPEHVWTTKCPACASNAFLAGAIYAEEASDDQEAAEPYEELVDISYIAEEFRCPSCGLGLNTRDEIVAAGLEVEHTETEARQREYEPDYGND